MQTGSRYTFHQVFWTSLGFRLGLLFLLLLLLLGLLMLLMLMLVLVLMQMLLRRVHDWVHARTLGLAGCDHGGLNRKDTFERGRDTDNNKDGMEVSRGLQGLKEEETKRQTVVLGYQNRILLLFFQNGDKGIVPTWRRRRRRRRRRSCCSCWWLTRRWRPNFICHWSLGEGLLSLIFFLSFFSLVFAFLFTN